MFYKYVPGTNASETLNAADGVTSGPDAVYGFGGHDTIFGLGGDDALWGGEGNDTLNGGSGHDLLDGGIGNDTMAGWTGNDTYYVDSFSDAVTEAGGQGMDTVYTSVSWTLTPGADVEVLRTTNDTGAAPIWLTGNASGQHIIGNDGDNVINGGGGNDQMTGRDGDDTYFVDNYEDEVFEAGGQGYDTVRASGTGYVLPEGADIEVLTTTNSSGLAPISLVGNSSGNLIRGNDGSNWIIGYGGNDELIGGGGSDQFYFAAWLDPATNVDIISDFNVADDTIVLNETYFNALPDGYVPLPASEFVIGAVAQDADDHIIYDSNTGALLYDGDGAGGAAAIPFAELSPGLALTYMDFYVS